MVKQYCAVRAIVMHADAQYWL